MLRSLKSMLGDKLGATDGELGHVKDFYFDDQSWAVRYLVADTGNWLPKRQVLLSPLSLGPLDPAGEVLRVNLTRKQIEGSRSIDTRKPVSRQYEEEYYRYYGWPFYWQGGSLWGMSGFPVLELPTKPFPHEPPAASGPAAGRAEAHLRSTRAVEGYLLRTHDGINGHVCDFMLDLKTWAIDQLAIKTGHRLTGKEVLISTNCVERISYEDSTVFVNLTWAEVERSPAHQIMPRAKTAA